MCKKILISISILLLIILVIVAFIYKNSGCNETLGFISHEEESGGPLMDTKYKRIHKKNRYVENED